MQHDKRQLTTLKQKMQHQVNITAASEQDTDEDRNLSASN